MFREIKDELNKSESALQTKKINKMLEDKVQGAIASAGGKLKEQIK